MSKQKDVCPQSESRDGRSDQVKARAGHLKELLPFLQESKAGSLYQEQNKNQIRVKGIAKNIARIANALQCHALLSGNTDCHEFKFSIVTSL